LPLYGINQIGISDLNEFTLCDPALYFRNEGTNTENEAFGTWIQKIFTSFFNLPLDKEQY
jgi:hypothetical protein